MKLLVKYLLNQTESPIRLSSAAQEAPSLLTVQDATHGSRIRVVLCAQHHERAIITLRAPATATAVVPPAVDCVEDRVASEIASIEYETARLDS